jgi:alkylation response protein AidB-like acyl-CoA dehydrogenase
MAKGAGKIGDKPMRQDLMRLHTAHEIARMNNLRAKAARAAKKDIPGLPNVMKLTMSHILRLNREIGLRILGPMGTLHAYDGESKKKLDEATGNPFLGMVTEAALFSPGPAIYGGTDQIQKNIIGERVLGLPKEPNQDKVVPFKELPKNG